MDPITTFQGDNMPDFTVISKLDLFRLQLFIKKLAPERSPG
jgi:hypothetical protein